MKKDQAQSIVILGCGNVAWHLAKHLRSLKTYSVAVYNHKANPALAEFKTKLKCSTGVGFKQVPADADVYFICVSDRAIERTANQLTIRNPNALVVHTSGSMPLGALGKRLYDTGVFYPLQTFSKKDTIHWEDVPVIIEASGKTAQHKLEKLAARFSKVHRTMDHKGRLKLHLAAVMVNNFTNALYVAAGSLIGDGKGNSIGLLLPLIRQTTEKLSHLGPLEAQTGPAKRGDTAILKKHRHLLDDQAELKTVYKKLSKLIVHQQEKRHA